MAISPRTDVPVNAPPADQQRRYRRILAAIDDSERGRRVAREAVALAGAFGAELTALHIIDPPLYPYGHDDILAPGLAKAQFLQYVREEALEHGHELAAYILGLVAGTDKPGASSSTDRAAAVSVRVEIKELSGAEGIVDRLLEEAAAGAYDLVVVGASSPRRLPLFHHSVEREIIARAGCPVIVIR